jgi:hypothetical protein
MEEQDIDDAALPGSGAEPGSQELAARLKAAVRESGGNTLVAQRAGVPLSTLNSYLRGVEMKVGALVRLAAATGVRLEWLATGQGPMRAGEGLMRTGAQLGEPQQQDTSLGMTWQANPDRLGRAYQQAIESLVVLPGQRPDPRRVMQVTLLLYDHLTEAEESAKAAPNAG